MSNQTATLSNQSEGRKRPAYALDLVEVSKRFNRQTKARGYRTIKSAIVQIFKKRDEGAPEVTCAVDGLTIRVPRGASLGIIGRNGSGKSTLLKLITGIYKPDKGKISVNGRIAALIELGAGFHPDFTGRENLYLSGIMHGLTRREIDERFETIVKFAELEKVIDDPVRTYSSGMFMRLGFSLAVHTDPDILIIDEVLAVGDASFVNKCKERLALLKKSGTTLLLVSHDLEAVERWCDEVVWLEKGIVRDRGEPRRVIDHYRQFIELGEEELKRMQETARAAQAADLSTSTEEAITAQRWGSREIEIVAARIVDERGAVRHVLHPEDSATIEIEYLCHHAVDKVVFGIGIHRVDGLVVHGTNTDIEGVDIVYESDGVVRYHINRVGLLDGSYTLDVAAHAEDGYPYDYHQRIISFSVRCPERQIGVYLPPHTWEFLGSRKKAYGA